MGIIYMTLRLITAGYEDQGMFYKYQADIKYVMR